jgi:hypothetical protein
MPTQTPVMYIRFNLAFELHTIGQDPYNIHIYFTVKIETVLREYELQGSVDARARNISRTASQKAKICWPIPDSLC